jgi:glutathione synthase/RimK-type ligase-like ATP-grasp enzyme
MNIWILCTPSSSVYEAKQIISKMKGAGKLVIFANNKWKLPDNTIPDLIVRWGCTVPISVKAKELNSIDAIFKCMIKPVTRLVLSNKGIPVPRTWMDKKDIEFPCIMRSERHWCGNNFFVADDADNLKDNQYKGNTYYQEIYPNEIEYRIHVMSGKVTVIARKHAIQGELRRNRHITHQAQDILKNIDPYIEQMAIDAVNSVGMDFGAVDIMTSSSHQHKAVVCEINTDPGLLKGGYCAPYYAEYFIKKAKEKK